MSCLVRALLNDIKHKLISWYNCTGMFTPQGGMIICWFALYFVKNECL